MPRRARITELMEREGIRSLRGLSAVIAERTKPSVRFHHSTLSLVARGVSAPSGRVRDALCEAFPSYHEEWLFPRVAVDAEPERVAVPA